MKGGQVRGSRERPEKTDRKDHGKVEEGEGWRGGQGWGWGVAQGRTVEKPDEALGLGSERGPVWR